MITSFNLNNFVTSTSKILFQKQKLPSGFLQKDPDTWNDDNDFERASSVVPKLKVVNDHAERGVVLIQEQRRFDCNCSTDYDYNYAPCNRFSITIISPCNRHDYIASPKLKNDFFTAFTMS